MTIIHTPDVLWRYPFCVRLPHYTHGTSSFETERKHEHRSIAVKEAPFYV